MAQVDKEIEKTIKKYRDDFRYFRERMEKIEGKRRELVEKKILRYFYKCQNVQVIPEPQDCLDILNEMQNV
jgi:hypothetical protein